MAVKKRINFNVDKLRLCYKQPAELFDELAKYTINKYLDYESFQLHIIDDGRGEDSDKTPMKIKANVILSDGKLLGEFVFHNSAQYDSRCFFTFANSSLYDATYFSKNEKFNHQSEIDYIADVLGLQLNNFTEIELAADVNFNIIPKVQKLIKDYENFDMVVNGLKIQNESRKIEGFGEYFGRSRAKRDKYPTLYFKQAKFDGLQLKIYDKSKEILEENPQKKYVETWNDFGKQKVYRLELTIRNEQFKKWLAYLNAADCPLPSDWQQFISDGGEHTAPSEPNEDYLRRSEGFLQLQAYKCPLWHFGANRLVYWRHRATNQVVSLIDVALGAAV